MLIVIALPLRVVKIDTRTEFESLCYGIDRGTRQSLPLSTAKQ
jgi:hypothetical protein